MRNLKKFLALVLAMAMAFSLMLSAGAVDYKDYQDKDSITPEFTEAVNVLTGLKVMQGDEKGFRPGDYITRAEAAAVIYRAVTGDVTNKQNDLYKDYNHFTDVNSSDWFAGYVGYCQNAGYIKGTTPTTFNPYGKVTGYEALAMILRAVGYGKNDEFTGSSWQVNVAALSRQLGVTRHVTAAHMEQTLNMSAPREVVADLIFMTIATVPTVTFTPALAYNDKQTITSEIYNLTLGQEVFGLFHDTTWQVIDDWGNPGYRWRDKGVWNGTLVTTVTGGKGYMVPANHPWLEASADTSTVATIEQKADYTTTEQVRECDVAAALDFDGEETFRLYVNQKGSLTDTYRVVATDTVTKVGGQGRLTKVYYEMENPWFTDDVDNHDMVVTMVDTMLALVTNKTACKTDAAGHIITPAQLEVTIYDGMQTTQAITNNTSVAQSNRVITKGSADSSNWDEYSKGDYILLNTYTNKTQSATDIPGNPATGFIAPATAAAAILGNNVIRDTQAKLEEAAFTTNKVVTGTLRAGKFNNQDPNVWIVDNGKNGIADSIQGKQTVTSWNTGKHTVDGKDYDDQICLFLDKAGRVTNTTFTWFFDQYGNLIGIGDAHAVNYGVITAVYAAQVQGDSQTTGGVKAIATVKFADGTTGTVEIDKFLVGYGTTSKYNPLPADAPGTLAATDYRAAAGDMLDDGDALPGAGGPPVTFTPTATQNTLELRPVFDNGTFPAMAASAPNPVYSGRTASIAAPGWIYMSPSTNTNTNAHFTTGGSMDRFGILYNNLFRFSVANDDSVIATEVAGSYTNTGGMVGTYGNENINFQDMANAATSSADVADSKLYKNLGYLALETDNSTGPDAYVYLSSDAKIMVKLGNDTAARTINCYNGLSELPGDVVIPTATEVDWTDTDGDGRADVVYIANGNMPSTVTYGLFYYNGGTAIWDGTTKTGTIAGWLNGDPETITFTNRTQFDDVQNSATYAAHLFALQFTNGNVSNVMVAENKTGTDNDGSIVLKEILRNEKAVAATATTPVYAQGANRTGVVLDFAATPASDTTATNIRTSGSGTWTWAGATQFALGTANGNPYSVTTEAVYYNDAIGVAYNGDTTVTYERVSNGHRIVVRTVADITASPVTYTAKSFYLAPNCKIIGELDWLNISNLRCDVTMVYDTAAADAVTEIYISRDQDITPVTPAVVVSGDVRILDGSNFTDVTLGKAIKAMGNNTVVYCPTLAADFASMRVPDTDAPEQLYFPVQMTEATKDSAPSLVIFNAAGDLMYSWTKSSAWGNTDGQYIMINFMDKTKDSDLITPMGPGTYTFQITAGGSTISSGTFTIG